MKLSILFCLLLSGCATPYKSGSVHEWTAFDTAAELSVVGLMAADWNQTVQIGRMCDERNRLLGPCPSEKKLALYFPSMMLGHAALAWYSPQPVRMFWQGIFFFYEAGTVRRNAQLGYVLRF